MECKCVILPPYLSSFCELIDTLWNVNYKSERIKLSREQELIDTLWNVNSNENLDSLGNDVN